MHRNGDERRLLGCGAGEDGKMTRWGEIKCPKCAAPPISLWDALARSLEEGDAREARLEAKLAKAVEALESVISCSNDVHIVHDAETTLAELKGQGDE